MSTYKYYINLDERGCFFADVRNDKEETIFEMRNDSEGYLYLIEDGWMRHCRDLIGLKAYLISVNLMINKDTLIKGN